VGSAPVGAPRLHALSRDAALVCVAGAFRTFGLTDAAGHMWTFVGCGLVVMLATIPYLLLTPAVEPAATPSERHVLKWTPTRVGPCAG
jgi:hypothetical protein